MSFFNFKVLCEKTIFQETGEKSTHQLPTRHLTLSKILKERKKEEGGKSKVLPHKVIIG
jgi:hypothetical protein